MKLLFRNLFLQGQCICFMMLLSKAVGSTACIRRSACMHMALLLLSIFRGFTFLVGYDVRMTVISRNISGRLSLYVLIIMIHSVSYTAFCSLPADPGPCRAAIPRYFFNSKTGVCEEFTYGGCDGNMNNFETLEECNQQCNPNGRT